MKDKEKTKSKAEKLEQDSTARIITGHKPFIFEEDKKVIEDLATHSSYVRGLFSA